jgi:hypothetical protein
MYVPSVAALLNTDLRASSDRRFLPRRFKQATAGVVSRANLIYNETSIAIGVDTACNYADQAICFGFIHIVG